MGIKNDARGEHKKELRKKNMKLVSSWFKNNPSSTQKEASEALGLSMVTVNLIMKELGAKKVVNYSFGE